MFVSPMLLHKIDEPFDDESYITELKLDGIRFIYSVDLDGSVRMYSRHNNEVTARFPELAALNLPPGTVLDGELIATDDAGKPDFEAVMGRFMSRKSLTPITYTVFDVLQYGGKSTIKLPLLDRKELLNEIVPDDTYLLSKVQFIEGNGIAYFDVVKAQALEGIVLKRKDSRYAVGKRSDNWLKVINYQYVDVIVTGWRKDKFGWLLNFADTGVYAGVMELGVPPDARRLVYSMPVEHESDKYAYLAQPFPVTVKYRNLTKAGLLRLPSLMNSA